MQKSERRALDAMLKDIREIGEKCERCGGYNVRLLSGSVRHCLDCGHGGKA